MRADPILLDVLQNIVHPVVARPGDVLAVYPDAIHVIRVHAPNSGALLPLLDAGALRARGDRPLDVTAALRALAVS